MMLGRKKRTPHLLTALGGLLALLLLADTLATAPLPFAAIMLARRALECVAVVAAAGEAGPGEAEREEPPAMLRRVRTTIVVVLVGGGVCMFLEFKGVPRPVF